MKKTIYKYELEIVTEQVINIPLNSEILSIQIQNDKLQLWALVDPKQEYTQERNIEIFGTGHYFNSDGVIRNYLTTFQAAGGNLVFHVFERII